MNRYWDRLSLRERTLALVTGCVVVASLCFGVVYRALGVLGDLESRIGQLEQELVNLAEQDAQGANVERAFAEVAAEHSSGWTEQEIHDRLRQEIYRLALKSPPAPDAKTSRRVLSKDEYMVQIPRLREGVLKEKGEGYREYQIQLRIPGTKIENVLTFVERLQLSRQLLRIDALELARSPQGDYVAATMEITRTVVDRAPGELKVAAYRRNLCVNPSFERWDEEENRFPSWMSEGCEVSRVSEHATTGDWAMRAFTRTGEGRVYQVRELEGGRLYALVMDVAARSPVRLSVFDGQEKVPYGEGQLAVGDGKPYRYEFRFRTPGSFGERRIVLTPLVELPKVGDEVFIDNVRLTKVRN